MGLCIVFLRTGMMADMRAQNQQIVLPRLLCAADVLCVTELYACTAVQPKMRTQLLTRCQRVSSWLLGHSSTINRSSSSLLHVI
jgi:hypothetical protein